jgi:hypothetical protein
MAAAAAAELGVLYARDGLVVADTPIGTESSSTNSYVTSCPARDKRFATKSNVSSTSLTLSPSRTSG